MELTGLLTLSDFEDAARGVLDEATWAYVGGGAGTGETVAANKAAFGRVWLRPRVFDAGSPMPDLALTLFGHVLSLPVLLAPTSPQRLLHEEAELATARAATATGIVSVVSTDSHHPFPAVAGAADKNCWFQLYAYRSRRDVEATIALAEEAGAWALVLTVDACHAARRISARRAGFRTPPHIDFGTLRRLGILDGDVPPDARLDRLSLGWSDLNWIRSRTSLPLLVKGVLAPDDARRCVDGGADGVIVSNHGGRQLDGVVPSLVALEQIAAVVGSDCTVLVDGGIRSGGDVIKALALGAVAVCIGRPYLWGLAIAGQDGVEAVITLLQQEIEDALRQLGVAGVADVTRDCVTRSG